MLHAVARRLTSTGSREAPSQGETLSRGPCRHQYAPVLKSGHQNRRKGGHGPGSSQEEQGPPPNHQGGKDRRIPPASDRCPNLIHCDVKLTQRFAQHKVFLQVDQNFQSNVDAVVPWKHQPEGQRRQRRPRLTQLQHVRLGFSINWNPLHFENTHT